MHNFEQDKVLFLEKGKKGLHRFIFGRTLLILISFLIQFGMMFVLFTKLSNYFLVTVSAYVLFIAVIELIIINKESNPAMKISWIMITMVFPVVGGLLFIYVDMDLGHRMIGRRVEELCAMTEKYVTPNEKTVKKLENISLSTANLTRYLAANGNYQLYENTAVTYFPSGEAKFDELIKQLERAEHYIFLEYFIICEGYMWGRVLNILQEKVKRGVEVRVMYDGFNTLTYLPANYPKKLRKLGIKCKVFSPIRPIFSTTYNNRDHRKILVIDGRVGFTGGINLADEYINQKERFGYWKDTAVMLEGDAVKGLSQLFLQMWNIGEKEPDFAQFLKSKSSIEPACADVAGETGEKIKDILSTDTNLQLREAAEGKADEQFGKRSKDTAEYSGFVQPYGDSPFDDVQVGKMVYMSLINRAERYVYIMTPYLILDFEMTEALIFAAKRGVDVKIILPHIPDKITAFALAKTHYHELIKNGVHIYEFTPGFVHAKVMVSDNDTAVVGTINLDYRSFYLHFENAVLLYQVKEIEAIKEDIRKTLEVSHEVTIADVKNEKLGIRILGILLKILAPLM